MFVTKVETFLKLLLTSIQLFALFLGSALGQSAGGTADDALVPAKLKEYAEDLFKKLKDFDAQIDTNLKKHADQLALIEEKRKEVKVMYE